MLGGFNATTITGVVGGVSAAGAIAKSLQGIPEGQQGFKLRFKKVVRHRRGPKKGQPKVYEPGFVWAFPWVHNVVPVTGQQQTMRCEGQSIRLTDDIVMNIKISFDFVITDIYKALYHVDNLHEALHNSAMGLVRELISTKSYEQMADVKALCTETLAAFQHRVDENNRGVRFLLIDFIDNQASRESLPLVFRKALATAGVNALNEAARDLSDEARRLPPGVAMALLGMPVTGVSESVSIPDSPAPLAATPAASGNGQSEAGGVAETVLKVVRGAK